MPNENPYRLKQKGANLHDGSYVAWGGLAVAWDEGKTAGKPDRDALRAVLVNWRGEHADYVADAILAEFYPEEGA